MSIMDASELLCSRSCSKINLYLKVTSRRTDGYHELESLFLPLENPADDVAIDLDALPGAVTVACSDVLLPGGLENIAGKAADLWARRSAVMPRWDINIVKNIPIAAGMGGGSGNAATVLKLLNDHYDHPLNDRQLAETALELGADVPFFLDPAPAIMSGIGETGHRLDFALPELPLLLIAPEFPVSAAEAYKLLPPAKISPMPEIQRTQILESLQQADWERLSGLLFNDLEEGIFDKYPLLKILRGKVLYSGALGCWMTGSGPTLFALYSNKQKQHEAVRNLSELLPACRIIDPSEKAAD